MSISGQQNINIGLPNESTGSDTLYTAFNKIQDNFVQLFNCSSPYNNFVASSGIGISTSPSTGTATFTNTGIIDIVAGTNIVISKVNGIVTISSTGGGGGGGGGTVTSVGLEPVSNSRLVVTNSPVVSSGVIGIDLASSGATAGTYNNPNMTVDRYGRVTSISNGASYGTVTSIGLTGGQGIQINGGPITSSGSILVTNTGVTKINAGSGMSVDSGTGEVTVSLASYVGTVTNVGLYSTSLTISGSPITTQGTIRIEMPTNPVFTGNLVVGNANLGNLAKANYFQGDGGLLSNINGANVVGQVANALVAGTVYIGAQPNITSVGTLTSLTVTGKVTAGQLQGDGGNISNITAGNITGQVANALVAGTVYTAAQPNITSTGTLTSLNVSGTVTASRFVSNVATGTAPFTVTSTTQVANLNAQYAGTANAVAGANVSGQVANALVAGTVYTNAQSNITSVGTLTGLTVGNSTANTVFGNGTITAAGNASVLGIKTDNYYYANGVSISFAGSYSNSNTASYLPTYTGTVGATTATLQGNTLTTGANTNAGTITGNWSLSAGSKLSSTYADLAEYYEADTFYEHGTVLMFGGDKEVTLATASTTRVAGVISKYPAYSMNTSCKGITALIALQGRVPCKVFGNIEKGDMMISAGNGYAMACNEPRLGQVIGKSLVDFQGSEGIIEIVVGRV
jgi:hypothetical protein